MGLSSDYVIVAAFWAMCQKDTRILPFFGRARVEVVTLFPIEKQLRELNRSIAGLCMELAVS
jgi:hypothetical protein